jgi:hypothetical protein
LTEPPIWNKQLDITFSFPIVDVIVNFFLRFSIIFYILVRKGMI